MTRRERMEARLEKRQEWAQSRDRKAAAAFAGVHRIADNIPLGQPILVGHHSERHARRDQERIHNGMSRGVESTNMASHHRSKADGIERQLETSIYSDDPDAVEALEARIAELEAKRERMSRCNRMYRKGDAEGLKAEGFDLAKMRIEIAQRYTWEQKGPFRPYELSNLGGNISRLKKRLGNVKHRQAQTAEAEAAVGLTFKISKGEYQTYLIITFAEKPDYTIITALKSAGFSWGSGSWYGAPEAFPFEAFEKEGML